MSTYRSELTIAIEAYNHDMRREIKKLESQIYTNTILLEALGIGCVDSVFLPIVDGSILVNTYKEDPSKEEKKLVGEEYRKIYGSTDGTKYRSNREVLQKLKKSYIKSVKHRGEGKNVIDSKCGLTYASLHRYTPEDEAIKRRKAINDYKDAVDNFKGTSYSQDIDDMTNGQLQRATYLFKEATKRGDESLHVDFLFCTQRKTESEIQLYVRRFRNKIIDEILSLKTNHFTREQLEMLTSNKLKNLKKCL